MAHSIRKLFEKRTDHIRYEVVDTIGGMASSHFAAGVKKISSMDMTIVATIEEAYRLSVDYKRRADQALLDKKPRPSS
jgi:hypothetical protein